MYEIFAWSVLDAVFVTNTTISKVPSNKYFCTTRNKNFPIYHIKPTPESIYEYLYLYIHIYIYIYLIIYVLVLGLRVSTLIVGLWLAGVPQGSNLRLRPEVANLNNKVTTFTELGPEP